jgi:hypothetical protein
MMTLKDEDLETLAVEIEAQYAHLDSDEWYRLVEIMMKRADV